MMVAMISPVPFNMAQSPSPLGMSDWTHAVGIMLLTLAVAPAMCTWLWILLRRRFAGQGDGETRCGRCRYPVRGLSSFECPECGADLRDVGMIKGGAKDGGAKAGLAWSLVAWTLMWIALLLMTVGMFEAAGGVRRLVNFWVWAVGWTIIGWFAGLVVMLKPRDEEAIITSPQPPAIPADRAAAASASHAPGTPPKSDAIKTGNPTRRNLTIVFIDAVNYSHTITSSTLLGVVDLVQRIHALVRPVIEQHHGRIVKTMGDGVLATFESPTQAVLASLAVQRAARQVQNDQPTAQPHAIPLNFRIGISTGEVAVVENDVYGDQVNLAARIQQLAEPGEVLFNEAVWHAMTRSEVDHEVAGEYEVKGFGGTIKLHRAKG